MSELLEAEIPVGIEPDCDKHSLVEDAFHQYRMPLKRYLSSSNLSDGEVEEIQQEAYVRLMKQDDIGRIKPKLKGYLFTIATNLLIDRIRKNKARCIDDHLPLEIELLPTDAPYPEEILSLGQSLETIKKAIKELRPKHRQVFVMNRFMHMEYAEIAVKLGVSRRTVERRMKSALGLIKRRLEVSL